MMKSKEFFSSRDKDKWDVALQIPFLLAHENVNKMENVLLLSLAIEAINVDIPVSFS